MLFRSKTARTAVTVKMQPLVYIILRKAKALLPPVHQSDTSPLPVQSAAIPNIRLKRLWVTHSKKGIR